MNLGRGGHVDMNRTAVIGNAGGGKSTLSRRLAEEFGLPYHQLDALLWGPGWLRRPEEIFEAEHRQLVSGESWIIDGVGRLESLPLRLNKSTFIILVDMPVWRHYSLAARRHFEWISGRRPHPALGVPPLDLVFEWIWKVDQHWMPRIRTLVTALEARGMAVTRLASPKEVTDFRPTGR